MKPSTPIFFTRRSFLYYWIGLCPRYDTGIPRVSFGFITMRERFSSGTPEELQKKKEIAMAHRKKVLLKLIILGDSGCVELLVRWLLWL